VSLIDEYIKQYYHTPTKEQLNSSFYITWTGYRKCGPNHVIGPRILENFKIVFVVKGKGYLLLGKEETCIQAGDMFILFPREVHYYHANPDDPWELMWVCLNGTSFEDMLKSIGITKEHCIFSNIVNQSVKDMLGDIINDLRTNPDSTNQLYSIGTLCILLSRIQKAIENSNLSAENRQKQTVIEQVTNFIEANSHMPLNVNVLCEYINYSRSYLSRVFKTETGYSIPEYINHVRINHAKQLLEETELSIQEIAISVGFPDAFYFSKMFKKQLGISPSNYKNK
jgi:AraC-like DNA-binding protein